MAPTAALLQSAQYTVARDVFVDRHGVAAWGSSMTPHEKVWCCGKQRGALPRRRGPPPHLRRPRSP
eukprot:2087081-Prorocentrum_lima.AAC.1